MATKVQTQQLYSGNKSAGVAVSPFSDFISQLIAHHIPTFSIRCSLAAVCSRWFPFWACSSFSEYVPSHTPIKACICSAYLFAAPADVTTSAFFHPQMSVVRSRRSSDRTLFVRTHVAMYFFCLLVCDFIQGIGALLNIPWIVEARAYIGPICTAQAAIKQVGNV